MATHQTDVSVRDAAATPGGEAATEPTRLPGMAHLIVPDTIGMSVLDADRLVREQQLRIAISVWETKIGPWGLVLSQDPEPGSLSKPRGRVHVVVAGRPHLTVPDVRNLSRSAATDTLRRLGLRPEVSTPRASRTVAADHVISTLPRPGSLIADGSTIALEVSRGRG